MKDGWKSYDVKAAQLINDFCLYARRDLGGEGPAINEETIAEQFAPAFRKHQVRGFLKLHLGQSVP